jgi:hypothetical protein
MPKEFLLAVMHDTTVSLYTRMQVAVELLKLWPERHEYVPAPVVIRIGGLPDDYQRTHLIEAKVHLALTFAPDTTDEAEVHEPMTQVGHA